MHTLLLPSFLVLDQSNLQNMSMLVKQRSYLTEKKGRIDMVAIDNFDYLIIKQLPQRKNIIMNQVSGEQSVHTYTNSTSQSTYFFLSGCPWNRTDKKFGECTPITIIYKRIIYQPDKKY